MKKEILDGDWLSDQHMFNAQELLWMQFPMFDGWQSTLLAQANAYIPVIFDGLGSPHCEHHWEKSSLACLLQKFSVAIQRGNAASVLGTLPPTLSPPLNNGV